MTEPAAPAEPPLSPPAAPTAPPVVAPAPAAKAQAAGAERPAGHARSSWRNPWFYLVAAAFGLALWQWTETRGKLTDTQEEVARRLSEADTARKEDRGALKLAQEQVAALQAKLGAVEARQAEFQGQTAALQNLYQDLAKGRDDASLLEIEQAIILAGQQIQLAGNVSAAVLALQSADNRLARLDRPQFAPLRKALGHDLERLQALPMVDLPGMNLHLENIILAADKLPLAMDERPAPAQKPRPAAAPAAQSPAPPETDKSAKWQRLGEDFWQEVKGLVRIQRFDRQEPVLLAPGQAFFLRENLKLRLLNARLALLSRDGWTFRNELKVAKSWLERHFDSQDKSVQSAQNTLKELAASEINIELPNLNESLSALRNFKPAKDKK